MRSRVPKGVNGSRYLVVTMLECSCLEHCCGQFRHHINSQPQFKKLVVSATQDDRDLQESRLLHHPSPHTWQKTRTQLPCSLPGFVCRTPCARCSRCEHVVATVRRASPGDTMTFDSSPSSMMYQLSTCSMKHLFFYALRLRVVLHFPLIRPTLETKCVK